MPLLARMLPAPLAVEVRRGAVARLGEVLTETHMATSGRVAVAVGPGQGEQVTELIAPTLREADVFYVSDASVDTAAGLGGDLRKGAYEAVVGVGGGRTIDVTKYAAGLAGLPMVAVATNLSHDGICSPTASLTHESGTGSFGVPMPLGIIVDLDFVTAAPPRLVRSGVGDAISNLSAVDDWWLAAQACGEKVDGLACSMGRTAAEAVLRRTDSIESDEFLTVLADALIFSGMAMVVAGSSRPASGGDHEILHAVNQLFPGTANHGELAGLAAAFCHYLRDPDGVRLRETVTCLRRHSLPVTPPDIGLTAELFAEAVELAPSTRPGRYTILEHLSLPAAEIRERVERYVRHVS